MIENSTNGRYATQTTQNLEPPTKCLSQALWVEPYSDKHFLDIVKLVESFHAEAVGEYDGFDADTLIETIKGQAATSTGNCFLLVDDFGCHGILFGVRFKSLISEKIIFQELIWYVKKEYRRSGISLLRFAENRLKESGVNSIIMAVLENSKTDKLKDFYGRLGYKPMETHFIKEL